MLQLFHFVLLSVYDLIFPWMFGHGYDPNRPMDPAPVDLPARPERPPSAIQRLAAGIYLDLYLPIFRPRLWWNHVNAINQLLDDIGWIDLDLDL
jgi:hypothetical protein